MKSFSVSNEPNVMVVHLDEKPRRKMPTQPISGWNGEAVDLDNAPQHLMPCSSLADAVIGGLEELSSGGTPYL